jgi:hypothetical protein
MTIINYSTGRFNFRNLTANKTCGCICRVNKQIWTLIRVAWTNFYTNGAAWTNCYTNGAAWKNCCYINGAAWANCCYTNGAAWANCCYTNGASRSLYCGSGTSTRPHTSVLPLSQPCWNFKYLVTIIAPTAILTMCQHFPPSISNFQMGKWHKELSKRNEIKWLENLHPG